MGEVVKIAFGRDDQQFPATYERTVFYCTECESRMFKIIRTDGEPRVQCANCEGWMGALEVTAPDPE